MEVNEKGNTLSHNSVFAGKICFAASFLLPLGLATSFIENAMGYLNLISYAFNWVFSLSWLAAMGLCVAAAIAKASRRDVRRALMWAFIGPASFFIQAFLIWLVALFVPGSPIQIDWKPPW